jgi:hypothetical protein
MFNDESVQETEIRDAGPAPSAPTVGPLMNISQPREVTFPEAGKQLPETGGTTARAESPRQTLFVSGQQEPSTPQTTNDIPVFDAGTARIDLMTGSGSTSTRTEH